MSNQAAPRCARVPARVFVSRDAQALNATAAAFFDLDGTLLPLPSLELRLWSLLRHRKRMGLANYLSWFREALRLFPRGIGRVVYANKAYLRGIPADEPTSLPIPPFLPEAIERVAWHARHGHHLVILSGTLEPLALAAARRLAEQVASPGSAISIDVRATRPELAAGSWTGRIVGEAMFGEAKARAIHKFCASRGIPPANCFAYGDSAGDQWMLDAVGRPHAVNPSDDLARIARRNGWPVSWWKTERTSVRPSQRGVSSFTDGERLPMIKTESECCR